MSFNFPNSPSQGQLYTPVGGYQYVYLDGVWRVVEAPQDVGTAQTRQPDRQRGDADFTGERRCRRCQQLLPSRSMDWLCNNDIDTSFAPALQPAVATSLS